MLFIASEASGPDLVCSGRGMSPIFRSSTLLSLDTFDRPMYLRSWRESSRRKSHNESFDHHKSLRLRTYEAESDVFDHSESFRAGKRRETPLLQDMMRTEFVPEIAWRPTCMKDDLIGLSWCSTRKNTGRHALASRYRCTWRFVSSSSRRREAHRVPPSMNDSAAIHRN